MDMVPRNENCRNNFAATDGIVSREQQSFTFI